MKIDLTTHEAALLKTHLTRRLLDLDRDLVRTDKFDLQHALAREIDELRAIEHRIERTLDEVADEGLV
jgi:hypothetical protein